MREAILNNLFMIIVILGYTAFVVNHYIRFKKYAGNKIKEYKHKSTVKMMGFVMLAIGAFYVVLFIIEQNKSINMIFTFCLFLYFVILVSFISIRDILMYENGIVFSGKFMLYSDMLSIEKINKNGIQIKTKKKALSEGVYINKVLEEKSFINDVKKNMKMARKTKKKDK